MKKLRALLNADLKILMLFCVAAALALSAFFSLIGWEPFTLKSVAGNVIMMCLIAYLGWDFRRWEAKNRSARNKQTGV